MTRYESSRPRGPTSNPLAVGVGLTAILAVGGLGLGPAAAWLPELFAARYRYTAAGLAYSLAAILGGAVPPVLAGALQPSYGGLAIGLLLAGFGLVSLTCGLALPETKHRTLGVADAVSATTPA